MNRYKIPTVKYGGPHNLRQDINFIYLREENSLKCYNSYDNDMQ